MQLPGLVETRWRLFWQFYCSVTQLQKLTSALTRNRLDSFLDDLARQQEQG